jgi:hypothetical protein
MNDISAILTYVRKHDHSQGGSVQGYRLGCREDECVESYRDYQLPKVTGRKAAGLPQEDARHGTYNGYANYGCRCPFCKEANRQHNIDYRLRIGEITREKAEELR